jgi:purine-binding chemotaxis protein CheW
MSEAETGRLETLQVVVFSLEGKMLALEILKVQEIIRMVEITPLPNMPSFALGVINLRGTIVPIINIREKLSLPDRSPSIKTCIILCRAADGMFGFLVDDVAEVMNLPREAVDAPESGPDWLRSDLFLGVGKLTGKLLVIIDSDRLLSEAEQKELQQVSSRMPG